MTTRERKDATMQVGDKIIIDYGSDRNGRHWWKVRGSETMHGPFATKAEAVRDSLDIRPAVRSNRGRGRSHSRQAANGDAAMSTKACFTP